MVSFKSLMGAAILCAAATIAQAQVVGVATNPQGSLYYSVGTAVAEIMQQKAQLTARVQPMSGSAVYAPLVNSGQVEFGLLNALDVGNAFAGVENFAGRKNPDLRLVGVMFSLPIDIAVPNDSPIKTIQELKGIRMPSQFTAQSTIRAVQDAVLATGGVSTADMKPFPVANYVKGMMALGDGKVDAALFGLGTAASQEVNVALSSHGGLRYISLSNTPQSVAALRKVFPGGYLTVVQPAPALVGILGPTTVMAYSAFLVTSSHVPADVVYKATKALFENKLALAAASATMKRFDPAVMAEANEVPYHAGAEKYFKEAKMWPPKKR
jgi:TRAP transporter TAXI family solute receptor